MKKQEAHFEDLMAAVCDGAASEAQIKELESLIRSDQDLCDRYLQYVDLHACLAEDCVETDVDALTSITPRGMPVMPAFVGGLIGLAAAVVVGLFVVQWRDGGGANPLLSEDYIAVVTNADGALWEGEDASVIIGSALKPGAVELCEGTVELQLDSGVHVAIEGPARFELLNEHRGILHRGKLSASVPPEGIGFTVDTPGMSVVDLGTEFGLNVGSNYSEVHVFDGEVEAILKGEVEPRQKELLTTSLTRRVREAGGELEAVAFNPNRFLAPPDTIPGIVKSADGIRALRTPPNSVQKGTYQHNYMLIFLEQDHIELEDPLEVSLTKPGRYVVGFGEANGSDFRHQLDVGVRVDSYFVHYDTKPVSHTRCRGMIQFQRPIVAVIAGAHQMSKTDELLGSWCTSYDRPETKDRQLENDRVTIGGDGRTLTLDWGVGTAADQIRVLVQADD